VWVKKSVPAATTRRERIEGEYVGVGEGRRRDMSSLYSDSTDSTAKSTLPLLRRSAPILHSFRKFLSHVFCGGSKIAKKSKIRKY
jgi:hypothetical protein